MRWMMMVAVLVVSMEAGGQASVPSPAAQVTNAAGAPTQQPAAQMSAGSEAKMEADYAKMKAELQDWAQLGRYRAADQALPATQPGRVVFYGDSITDAWEQNGGSFFPGKPYVNRGISGQTTPQMLVRFRQDVVDLHPEAVVILAGTNDIAGNTGPSTAEMIEDNFQLDGGDCEGEWDSRDSGVGAAGGAVSVAAGGGGYGGEGGGAECVAERLLRAGEADVSGLLECDGWAGWRDEGGD